MHQLPTNHLEKDIASHSAVFTIPRKEFASSWIIVLAATFFSAYLIQKLLQFLNHSLLYDLESLRNYFVYLMPSRVASFLHPNSLSSASDGNDIVPKQYAARSDVLRTVFGLDKISVKTQVGTSEGVPAGLGNWDNSCYQNSVLQSLASITSLRGLLDSVQSINKKKDSTNTTLHALSNLIRDLNDRNINSRHLWTPQKLKSMSSWQQQDAQEYYSKIIEQLEKDIAAIIRASDVTDRGLGPWAADREPTNASLPTSQDEGNSLTRPPSTDVEESILTHHFSNPLEGLLAQRVGCTKCGHSDGLSLIPFNCITLPLGRECQFDLKDCLEAFTELEYIEGVECAKCTLLQARHHLRQCSETLGTAEEDSADRSAQQEEQQRLIDARLEAVSEAIREHDFAETTLSKKCNISNPLRVTTTKTRQAIVARAPSCLVMHINRSLFDENTGNQLKNYAEVQFSPTLDLTRWCVGNKQKMEMSLQPSRIEEWEMDPSKSMIHDQDRFNQAAGDIYELQAVITHYGRHENGHYICYRKLQGVQRKDISTGSGPSLESQEQWWRFSDENVSKVNEDEVLAQGGVFMLFYERMVRSRILPSRLSQSRERADGITPLPTITTYSVVQKQTQVAQGDSCSKSESPLGKIQRLPLRELEPPSARLCEEKKYCATKTEIVKRGTSGHSFSALNESDGISNDEGLLEIPRPSEARRSTASSSTMRTAGMTPRHSEQLSPMKAMRMIATL